MSTVTDKRAAAKAQLLQDVFTTAIEGGINSWATVLEYDWDRPDWYAVISEVEERNRLWIDVTVIRRGVERALAVELNTYNRRAVRDIFEGDDDRADYDAGTASIIVELGLFDEIRYC